MKNFGECGRRAFSAARMSTKLCLNAVSLGNVTILQVGPAFLFEQCRPSYELTQELKKISFYRDGISQEIRLSGKASLLMASDESPRDELAEVLERAKGGDKSALGQLFDRYRPLLRARADESLGVDLQARVDASDVIQQTCLSANGSIKQFQGTTEPEFVQWLLRILERNVLDAAAYERKAAKRAVDREVADSAPLRLFEDKQTSPSQRAIRGEQVSILKEAIAQLPQDQREAVQIKFMEQATLAETARRMGKTEDAVSGLLRRGILKLNDLLTDLDAIER